MTVKADLILIPLMTDFAKYVMLIGVLL